MRAALLSFSILLLGTCAHAQGNNFGKEVVECATERARAIGEPFDGDFGPCEAIVEKRREEARRAATHNEPIASANPSVATNLAAKPEAGTSRIDTPAQTSPETIAMLDDMEKTKSEEGRNSRKIALYIATGIALIATLALGITAIYLFIKAKPWRIVHRANTRTKRIALLAFPFFAVIALYRWEQDLDHYRWEPSLSFLIFSMASVLCLLLAFTRLWDWIDNK